MVQENQDFTIYAGNVKTLEYTITDEETGVALDITGYTIKWAATALSDGAPLVAEPSIDLSSSGAQITLGDPTNGRVDVDLIIADTTSLAEAGETGYYVELEAFDTGGDPVVVSTGTMTVKPNVVNA